MGHIFISHVEENADLALGIADGLDQAGYRTWCYERDALPGPSYLIQTAREIEESAAVVLLISPDSLGSRQVTAEVVRAHESGRPFIPVLIGISHVEFAARQPEWREALGSATSVALPSGGVDALVPRILAGLGGLGIVAIDGDLPRERRVYTTPKTTRPPPVLPSRGSRRKLLVGAVAGGALAAVAGVAVIALALTGGDGEEREAAQIRVTDTAGDTVPAPSDPAAGGEGEPNQFASAVDTPVATSAGSHRVTDAALTQKACPPPDIPGDCLSASGSERYLVLHLVPAQGGTAALTQVFTTEAHQSLLTFGGGLQAGSYRVSLDSRSNRIEIVYGVLPANAADDDVLLRWPGNQDLLLAITA